MLRSKWMGTLALVLALVTVAPTGVAHAAPASATPADGIFTVNRVFDWVLEWLVGWSGGAAAKAGMMIDPNGGGDGTLSAEPTAGTDKAGPMVDPDEGGSQVTAAGGVCGDAGGMIDPDGNPCRP